MTTALAGLFSRLFPAIVLGFALAVCGGAGGYYLATGHGVTAAAMVFGGLALVVVLFGMTALQLENTALLRRIAEAGEAAARSGAHVSGARDGVQPVVSFGATSGAVVPLTEGTAGDPGREVPAGDLPQPRAAGLVASRGHGPAAPRPDQTFSRPVANTARAEPVVTIRRSQPPAGR